MGRLNLPNHLFCINYVHLQIVNGHSIKLIDVLSYFVCSLENNKICNNIFFFYLFFLITNIHNSQDSRGMGGYLFNSFLPLPPTSQTLDIFFLSGFSFTNIHESQDCRGRGKAFLYLLSTTSTRFTDT